jgi:hypothetical protein
MRKWILAGAVLLTAVTACSSGLVPAAVGPSQAAPTTSAAKDIPASAIVVTEQSIGDLINQRWYTVEKSGSRNGDGLEA